MAVSTSSQLPNPNTFWASFWAKNARFLFILPAVLFVLLMMVFPIGYTAFLSLHNWSGSIKEAPRSVQFDNYRNLLTQDPRFGDAVIRTFIFSTAAVTLELMLGLGIALLVQKRFLGQGLIKTLILLPMVATPVAIGMVWLLMYEPNIGLLNNVMRILGLRQQPWLGSEQMALGCLVAVDIWQWTPMMALILLAGLTTLPEEPFEAARVDGANTWQRFRRLTLPLLFPTMIAAALLRSIDALKTFDIIYTMTRGGPGFSTETINIYGYVQSFEYFALGKASSLLLIFFAIVLGISLLFVQVRKRWGAPLA
jgi:multiple sugar transport system permease protein